MALNLWTTGGNSTSYNPLPLSASSPKVGTSNLNYIISFYAKSNSSAVLNLYQNTGINVLQTLTPTRTFYSFTFSGKTVGSLFVKDLNNNGDIVIDSINLVQAPLNQLTINGVDGFLSGNWSQFLYGATAIDDRTITYTPTAQYQNVSYDWIPCLPNTTYTISASQVSGNGAFIVVNFFAADKTTGYGNSNLGTNSTLLTFTTPSNCYYIEIGFSNRAASGWTQCIWKNVMLNLGATPAPYSKKTGNIMVMPTASINMISPNSINNPTTTGRISYSNSGNYTQITTSVGATTDNYFELRGDISIPTYKVFKVISGNTYTFSGVLKSDGVSPMKLRVVQFDSNSNLYSDVKTTAYTGTTDYLQSYTFTVDPRASYVLLRVQNDTTTVGANGWFKNLQLSLGSAPANYSPYAVQVNKTPQRYVPKKNIFDGNYGFSKWGVVNVINTLNADGSFTIQNNNYATPRATSPNFPASWGGKTITCSVNVNSISNGQTCKLSVYDLKQSAYLNETVFTSTGRQSVTCTLPSDCTGCQFWVKPDIAATTNSITVSNAQAEFGSTVTLYEPYTPVLSPINTGMKFNGNNDSITFTDAPDIRLNNFSIETMIYFNSAKNYEVILQKGEGGASLKFNYALWLYGSGQLTLMMGNGTTGYSASTAMPLNQWVHVVASYDGTALKIYLNGVLQQTYSISTIPYTGTENLYIGKYGTGMNASIDGNVKYINLYNRALNANEITSRYNGGPIPTGIVRNYDFTNPNKVIGNTLFPSKNTSASKNLFNQYDPSIVYGYYLASDGTQQPSAQGTTNFISGFIPVTPNTSYAFSKGTAADYFRVGYYDSNKNFIKRDLSGSGVSSYIVTTPSNAAFVMFSTLLSDINTVQMELGSTPTSYVPYALNISPFQNLIPSFDNPWWTIHPNASVMGKDVLHLNATAIEQASFLYKFPLQPNTTYIFTHNDNLVWQLNEYDANLNFLRTDLADNLVSHTFTTLSNTTQLQLKTRNATIGSFDFIRPQLYVVDGTQGTINGSPIPLLKPSKRTLYNKR